MNLFRLFFKKEKGDRDEKNILIVRTDVLGDFIISIGFIKKIRKSFPDYKIFFLGDEDIKDSISLVPEIDEFIPVNIKKFQLNPFYFLKIAKILSKIYFSKIFNIVFERYFTGDEIVSLCNAEEKICFDGNASSMSVWKKRNEKFYTSIIPTSQTLKSEIFRYKEFLDGIDIDTSIDELLPRILISEELEKNKNIFLKNKSLFGKYIVIFPGARTVNRIWPKEKYISFLNWFQEKYPELSIVFCGSVKERELCQSIIVEIKDTKVFDFSGELTIPFLSTVLHQATFYFGSDTGPMHLAAAVGTPVICLLGGGHFGRFFPYGDLKKNRIVYDKHMTCMYDNWACAKGNITSPCIAGITVESAKEEVEDLLRSLHLINLS